MMSQECRDLMELGYRAAYYMVHENTDYYIHREAHVKDVIVEALVQDSSFHKHTSPWDWS